MPLLNHSSPSGRANATIRDAYVEQHLASHLWSPGSMICPISMDNFFGLIYNILLKHHTIDSIFLQAPGIKGSMCFLIDALQASVVILHGKLKTDWEQELSGDVWEAILDWIHCSSINARQSSVQFKVVPRLNYVYVWFRCNWAMQDLIRLGFDISWIDRCGVHKVLWFNINW